MDDLCVRYRTFLALSKAVEFQTYLDRIWDVAKQEERALIQALQDATTGVLDRFVVPAIHELRNGSDGTLPTPSLMGANSLARDAGGALLKFHESYLPMLPPVPVGSGVYCLIESLFLRQERTGRFMPHVYPRSEYSSVEHDIRHLLLQDAGGYFGQAARNTPPVEALGLPMLEARNPIMWTLLAHEMGEALDRRHDVTGFMRAAIRERGVTDTRVSEALQNWVDEFAADVIALRLVGGPYLCAFTDLALLQGNITGEDFYHPSARNRVDQGLRRLRAHGAITRDFKHEDCPKPSSLTPDTLPYLCARLLHRCSHLDPSPEAEGPELEGFPTPTYLDPFMTEDCDNIDRIAAEEGLLPCPRTADNTIKRLLKTLRKGEPIGTLSLEFVADDLVARIDTAPDVESFHELLAVLEHHPTDVVDILLAGWLIRFSDDFGYFNNSIVDSGEANLPKRFGELRDMVEGRALLLEKSMEDTLYASFWSASREEGSNAK
jgi:hypothetical protein